MIYLKNEKEDSEYKKKLSDNQNGKKRHVRLKIKKGIKNQPKKKRNIYSSEREIRIMEFLNSQHVVYEREYGINIYEGKKVMTYYFDFYVPEFNLLIEYDGAHHFHPVYGDEKLAKTKEHDLIKDRWARKNKMHLLRIPFYKADKIDELITAKCDKVKPIK